MTAGPINGPEQLAIDYGRQDKQRIKVLTLMADGAWRTLAMIALRTGEPEASVSARLRDLRKPRYGSWQVDKRRVVDGGGTWEYRVIERSEQ